MTTNDRFFSSPENLALSVFTDGVPLFKSSPVSLWPVYLVILNLPAKVRMKSQNVILCGLWVGPIKPVMKLLLEPIMTHLRRLCSVGLAFTTPNGALTNIRTKVVLGIFDLPAKAAVLNAKQFNGKYGCAVCIHPGKRLENGARVYLPGTYNIRTHEHYLDSAEKAVISNTAVFGIVGHSPLSSNLDLPVSIPVDYMHAVLEGVVRTMMRFWFDSRYHGLPCYIGRSVSQIDSMLVKQRPPTEFTRAPRSIEKHMKYWKASELRQWLLYYSLPLLLPHLPSLYWHHYALLVCAIHILLKDHITLAEVDAAEEMLNDFYVLFAELYGEGGCTHNVHLLSHLAYYVRFWGPLWTHSAFCFESKNGHLQNLFHGNSKIFKQLLHNIDVSHTLQLLNFKLKSHENINTVQFIDQLSHSLPRSNMTCISPHVYIIGKVKISRPTPEQCNALKCDGLIETFTRLFKNGILYHAIAYSKSFGGRRNDTTCVFVDSSNKKCFGQIEIFVNKPVEGALVRVLTQREHSLMKEAGHPCRPQLLVYKDVDLLSSFFCPIVSTTNQLIHVPIDCICSKVVSIYTSSSIYLILQPNAYEFH